MIQQGEMGHKLVKNHYKRTNRREPEKQMTEMDQRLANLQLMEELYEQAKIGSSEDEDPTEEASGPDGRIRLELHYQISKKGAAIRLGDWLDEHEADPAIIVRLTFTLLRN